MGLNYIELSHQMLKQFFEPMVARVERFESENKNGELTSQFHAAPVGFFYIIR
jgi:hypothetical protein